MQTVLAFWVFFFLLCCLDWSPTPILKRASCPSFLSSWDYRYIYYLAWLVSSINPRWLFMKEKEVNINLSRFLVTYFCLPHLTRHSYLRLLSYKTQSEKVLVSKSAFPVFKFFFFFFFGKKQKLDWKVTFLFCFHSFFSLKIKCSKHSPLCSVSSSATN
jgi:hypothetical protein